MQILGFQGEKLDSIINEQIFEFCYEENRGDNKTI